MLIVQKSGGCGFTPPPPPAQDTKIQLKHNQIVRDLSDLMSQQQQQQQQQPSTHRETTTIITQEETSLNQVESKLKCKAFGAMLASS